MSHTGTLVSSSDGRQVWDCCAKPERVSSCNEDPRPPSARLVSEGGELVWATCGNCRNKTCVPQLAAGKVVYCNAACETGAHLKAALRLQGLWLGHPENCPGCRGSGIEDFERWGGGEELCRWARFDGGWHRQESLAHRYSQPIPIPLDHALEATVLHRRIINIAWGELALLSAIVLGSALFGAFLVWRYFV